MINRIPRGGFAVPVGGRTFNASDLNAAFKTAKKIGKNVRAKGLLKTVKGLAVKGVKAGTAAAVEALAEKAWASVNKEINQRLDSKRNGRTLVANPTELTGTGSPIAAASVLNGISKMQLANQSDDRVIHKTHYKSGYPITSKMKRLLKQNGATYKVLADSKIEQTGFLGRNYLTQNSGFNIKRYHVPPVRAQVPNSLIRDLCMQNTMNDLLPTYADARTTSAVVSVKQQFMIKNQSVALPMDFTIHLVKITDTALINVVDPTFHSFPDFIGRCFTAPTPTTTLAGRVPQWYVATTPLADGIDDERYFSVDVLTSMKSLNYSPIFRGGMEIVESFKKTLAPGDMWNFSHTHSTGNGIDISLLSKIVTPLAGVTQPSTQVNNIVLKDKFPFTYGVVFEAVGKQGEIYHIPEVNQLSTYIGATPTAWSYEYKSSAYYVTDPAYTTGTAITSIVPFAMENVSQASLRRASVSDDRKPFFLPFEQIAGAQISEADVANVGRGYVPVTTSASPTARVYEGSTPG